MNKSLLLILVSVCLAVAGQILLKIGMTQVGVIGGSSVVNWRETLLKIIVVPQVWLGLLLYVISAISWLVVLSRVDLSFAYPFAALGYALVVLVSWVYLKESISLLRWLGVLIICVGVIFIAKS
ncbi:EamA family transporter [Candidatus Oleimmundimicrobium sp.]|uniref:EamA family transporter n=1 Tax=Candidatus Oleimmundimicrobium sp. TaxID=3060597 RepID=UPI0027282E0F|nr:EamA family transporter [Candidatus Oleimmundimicrobium sp.]MDO8886361.1 EamA family transporter [Candidatus Oleimmundimicrobium sp.]